MKKEISIRDIRGIKIGQAENRAAGTGCTVFFSENGMRAGLDVRGGGPASRESELLNPLQWRWPAAAPMDWERRTASCSIWRNETLDLKWDAVSGFPLSASLIFSI